VANKTITKPEDIIQILQNVKKGRNWVVRSIRNLINYYVDVKGLDETVAIKLKKACKMEKSGVRAVFLRDDEVKEAYHQLSKNGEHIRIFIKLEIFSGIRGKHAYEMLRGFNKDQLIKIPEKGIARYPIVEYSKGNKRGFFAYFPIEFADELRRFDEFEYRDFIENSRYRRVNSNSIRKWHYNKLIECGIDASIADFIQGRAPASVGAMHYLATARQADKAYSKAVVEIRKVLE